MAQFQSFAIVPAAGAGQRLGGDKLLLPWRGKPLIEHVLLAWTNSATTRMAVVVRPDDRRLVTCCKNFDVDVVVPEHAPPEMKNSVLVGLDHVRESYDPLPADVWLIAPADLPLLSAQTIDRVLSLHDPLSPKVIIPTHAGRRGHPAMFPWGMVGQVRQLAQDEGVNVLLQSNPVRELPLEMADVDFDVDTLDDYRRLLDRESR